LRVTYKSFPFRNPGVPEQTLIWRPILSVQIIHNHAASKRFEAVLDTGSDYCLFDANIGASIGVKIVDGPEGPLGMAENAEEPADVLQPQLDAETLETVEVLEGVGVGHGGPGAGRSLRRRAAPPPASPARRSPGA